MNENTPFGLADDGYEKMAKEMFPFETMSPEEYAARYGHGMMCFSFDRYSYRDKDLEDWLYRFWAASSKATNSSSCTSWSY